MHRLAPNMLKVLNGQDSPHFTFDAVIDMGIQQEGVFAGHYPCCQLQLNAACNKSKFMSTSPAWPAVDTCILCSRVSPFCSFLVMLMDPHMLPHCNCMRLSLIPLNIFM